MVLILSKSEVSVVGSVSGSFGLDLELFDFECCFYSESLSLSSPRDLRDLARST